MRFMLIGRQEDELLDAVILPFGQKLIERPVKRLALHSRGTGIAFLSGVPDSVAEGGRQKDPASPGDGFRHPLGNESVAPERKMRPVLDQRPNGKNEARIPGQDSPNLWPREVLEGP